MRVCPKCNNKFSLLSRLKSIDKSVIECGKCKNKYKMKYSKVFPFISVILIFFLTPRLDSFFPETSFLISMIRDISIVVFICYMVFFILSYFVKYEEYEDSVE